MYVMKAVKNALQVDRWFAVADRLWSNGICERMTHEIIRTLKAMVHEERREVRE